MKTAVLGYSGSGKSTLARTLGERYGCPVLHLDQVQYTENWTERDRKEALTMVEVFMARECWVIDGNYTGFLQVRRLDEADSIVFLNFNRWACLRRVWRRARQFRGRTRPDMADGCIEKLDLEFVCWVMWKGRTRKKRRHYRNIAENYSGKTVILKNQRELDHYLEGIPC